MEPELLLDKNQIIESFKDLPDKVSPEVLIERILFIKLIENRLRETTEVPHEQVMNGLKEMRDSRKAQADKVAA
jgi:hypothetical protein